MRTNIVIDDELLNDAMRLTGVKTKREAVELALKSLILLETQKKIKHFRGKLEWSGDLKKLRAMKCVDFHSMWSKTYMLKVIYSVESN